MFRYSTLEVLLHRKFLGDNSLTDFFYQRLINSKKNKQTAKNSKHIFILGLARSGTTSLLNRIYTSKNIGSILYKHMPFILSPNLANIAARLSNENSESHERYHSDNIFISLDSPECLDEPFWIKSNPLIYEREYIKGPVVTESMLIGYGNLLNKFSRIQNINRLVIKNNNNHIRLKYLTKYFEKSTFLVLFREPRAQAFSLREQHIKFCNIQLKDRFIAEYMNLIGHHEFGSNIKPFVYNDDNKWFRSLNYRDIDYWITQWIKTYSYLIHQFSNIRKNILFVSYEKLCEDKKVFDKIQDLIDISCPPKSDFFKIGKSNSRTLNESCSELLLNNAKDVYEQLNELSVK